MTCKTHPDAPHGFDRNASHSQDRYVCECESWEPPEQTKPMGVSCPRCGKTGLQPDSIHTCTPLALVLADEYARRPLCVRQDGVIEPREALRTAIEQALSNKENIMPITDDHGVATTRQFRVIEQRGRWQLLFDMHQIGNTVHHEFRIQKLRHDIVLYPGISLADAKQRFAEKVEADDE